MRKLAVRAAQFDRPYALLPEAQQVSQRSRLRERSKK
jgi:hypothetical protein